MKAAASRPAAPRTRVTRGLPSVTRRPSVEAGRRRDDHALAGARPASTSVPRDVHEAQARDAVVDHEDRASPARAAPRPRRARSAPCAARRRTARGRTCPDRRPAASGSVDLDEERPGVGVDGARDFRHVPFSVAAVRVGAVERRPAPQRRATMRRPAIRRRARRAGSRACLPRAAAAGRACHVARLDQLLGDDAVEGRGDAREGRGGAGGVAGGLRALDAGGGLLHARRGAGGRALRRPPAPRWPRPVPARWPTASPAARRCGRGSRGPAPARPAAARSSAAAAVARLSRACAAAAVALRAPALEVAAVEHDQHLARAHAVAGRDAHREHRRQHARGQRGRGARLHDAAGLERVGEIGRLRPWRRSRVTGGRRLLCRARRSVGQPSTDDRPIEQRRRPAQGCVCVVRHHVGHRFPSARSSVAAATTTSTRRGACRASACCTASAARSSAVTSASPLS